MRVVLLKREGKKGTTPYLRWWNPEQKKYEHEFLTLLRLSGEPNRKLEDKEKWRQADMARILKEQELTAERTGTAPEMKRKMPFIEYFESVKRNRGWDAVLSHLKNFSRKDTPICEVNENFVNDLRNFLTSRPKNHGKTGSISNNTSQNYYQKISACMNSAIRDKILTHNPCRNVATIKLEHKKIKSLSAKDIEFLSKQKMKRDETRRAFIFSCLTGLRYSDIKRLTFNHIFLKDKVLVFQQKKTKQENRVPLTKQALALAYENIPQGTTPLPSQLVFPDLGTASRVNLDLKEWGKLPGYERVRFHFHLARTTFASTVYEGTEDVYAVKELLGHMSIAHTQKYLSVSKAKLAKVVNTALGNLKIKTK